MLIANTGQMVTAMFHDKSAGQTYDWALIKAAVRGKEVTDAGIEARRERAKRWAHIDLHGYPTLSAEEETEETLAAARKAEQKKKGKIDKE